MFNFPKKFWRHCWNAIRFVALCSLAEMAVEALHRLGFIEHYGLIEFCFDAILGAGVAWFVWRAYVGMERDLDIYEDP